MSDSERGVSSSNPGDSVSDQSSSGLLYTCRKCPDEVFTASQKEQHREFHRRDRQKHKKKPGPRNRKKNITPLPPPPGSVDSNATTLFNIQNKDRYPKRDKNKTKTPEESMSPKSRERRAREEHIKNARKTKKKYDGN